VPGLSAQEVAELVGVSDVWYSRFESGRAQFSVSTLDRLATVLRLDEGEREVLVRLSRPDVVNFSMRSVCREMCGGDVRWASILVRLQSDLYVASSREEIRDQAVLALEEIARPSGASFWAQSVADGSARFPVALGRDAEYLRSMYQPSGAVTDDELAAIAAGEPYWCENLRESGSAEIRKRVDLGMLAYMALSVHSSPDEPWAAIGYENRTESEFGRREKLQIALVASAVRWALRAS
jgi:transcriptional regulator with XRE-family HTH domain